MSFLTRVLRAQPQIVQSSQTVTSGSTTPKDFTVSPAVADYTKCVLLPALEAGAGGGSTRQAPAYSSRSAGGGGSFTMNKAPEMTSNSNIRFTIDANSGGGDVTLTIGVMIVPFY